jgi:hypothetical protein
MITGQVTGFPVECKAEVMAEHLVLGLYFSSAKQPEMPDHEVVY